MSAPARPRQAPETGTEAAPRLARRWHVILHDDDDHTYEYVIEMLGRLFGQAPPAAYAIAHEVHTTGRCVVYTGHREHAELKQEQIHGYGADPRVQRCRGSMSAALVPAD